MDHYIELLEDYSKIHQVGLILNLLMWDQNSYMPSGAVKMRGDQNALLSGYAHNIMTSRSFGDLIEKAGKASKDDSGKEAVIRELKRIHDRATSIPEDVIKRLSRLESLATESWTKARQKSDFNMFSPILEEMVSLKMKVSELVGYDDRPYDALLDEYEPYMKSAKIEEKFKSLRNKLKPMVSKLSDVCRDLDTSSTRKGYPVDAQRRFSRMILEEMGYDFNRGRLDETPHPFTSGSLDDVRVTVRYDENDIKPGLFSTIHEGGHALYEQGFLRENYETPLAESVSLGIHESQSRMWENLVGRSRGFWDHYYTSLQDHFPAMKNVPLDDFHRSINHVSPSLIRVEADEVTYSMHVIIRFEIEMALTDGNLDVAEIPEVWNDKYEDYLGIRPENDAEGCLQDIHWAIGAIGYFPTYNLGNLYSAQFYDRAVNEIDDLEGSISSGNLRPLLGWLRTNIHEKGKLLSADDLVKDVTGKDLDEDHFIDYLKRKYSDIYSVTL